MSEELFEPKRIKAEEWADYYDDREAGLRLHRQRKRMAQGGRSSWDVVNMSAALKEPPVRATVGQREDGVFLLYRKCDHVVYGNSYTGKSWFALAIAAQELNVNHRVLYIDFEDDAKAVGERLLRLGVSRDLIEGNNKRFDYVRPDRSMEADDEESAMFERLLTKRYRYIVLDGVTEAMSLEGLNPLVGADVAAWQMRVPRRLAAETGAAVLVIDHVTNDAAQGGRPIGSERKVTGVRGATFAMVAGDPFVDGGIGCSTVRIGKDRHGQVNKHGVGYDQKTRTHKIASFELDSTQVPSVARITLPTAEPDKSVSDEDKRLNTRKRRTWHMEQISKWFEDTVPAGEARSKQLVITEMMRERKEAKKPMGRDCWRQAIEFMVEENYLAVAGDTQNGQSADLRFVGKCRKNDDPLGDASVRNWKVKLNDDATDSD